jgi:hypothetical protein
MGYSKGVSWIVDCRIPFVDGSEDTTRGKYENKVQVGIMAERPNIKFVGSFDDSAKQGRFTPNLLVCDDMLNDGIEHKSGKVKPHHKRNKTMGEYQGNAYGKFNNVSPDLNYDAYYGDKGSNSRYYDLDKWFDNMIDSL